MKFSSDWFKIVGSHVVVLMFLAGGMNYFNLLPWLTPADLKNMNTNYNTKLENIQSKLDELNLKYDSVMNLKNQDNQWYLEISTEMSSGFSELRTDVNHLKTNVQEMRSDIKSLLRGSGGE